MRPSSLHSSHKPRKPRLARYRALCGLATLLALVGSLVGCATPSTGSGGSKGWTMPWSKPAEPKPATYEQLSKDYQQRKIVSPALGLDQSIEPNAIQSAASSVSASVKEGADKVTTAIRPKPAASESTSKFWPFSKKDEVSADFYVEIAQVYEKTEPEQAAAQYEKALALEPKNLEALLAYAHLEDRTEKIEKAIGLYNRAMTAYPKDPRAANDLGLCYARHERYDEAIACLNKAINLKPDRELYRNNIATVLVKMGRTDDAVKQVSAVYGEAVARYNVALMLHNQGNREGAETQIVKALQIKPDLAQAQQWLTQLRSAGEHQQMAESGFVQGPVAVAGGAYSDMNQIPQMATPASATIETARAPRGPAAPPPNFQGTYGAPRPPQMPAAAAPQPPPPRVTQMSAVSDTEAETADAKQAVMTTILASDEK